MTKDRLTKNLQILFFVTIILTIIALYYQQQTHKESGSRLWPGNKITPKTEYYPNGKIRAAGTMKGYLKHGKWSWFDNRGQVIRVEYYRDGNLEESKEITP
jgi:antitoxin component YwqK of YwqJK toxin-antitoxin module